MNVAYPLGHYWVVVRELSVILFDSSTGSVQDRHDHHEVLLKSKWKGDVLVIEDFKGRQIQFEPDAARGKPRQGAD